MEADQSPMENGFFPSLTVSGYTTVSFCLVRTAILRPLPSQYMEIQYKAVSEAAVITNNVEDIILNRAQDVNGIYARTCNMEKQGSIPWI